MNDVKQKINYLKGLMDGLDLPKESKESRLFSATVDILEEITDKIHELQLVQEEVEEYMDNIDEDLHHLESDYYGEVFLYQQRSVGFFRPPPGNYVNIFQECQIAKL
jgi:phosphoglycerate-specific signal transduction histidine kinase